MASFNSHSIHKCSVSKYSHFVLGLQYVDGRDQIQSLAQLPILAQGPRSSLFRSAPGMERCTIVQTIGMGAPQTHMLSLGYLLQPRMWNQSQSLSILGINI